MALTAAQKRAQLKAQQTALAAKTKQDVSTAQAATGIAPEPYVEETPVPDFGPIGKAIETGSLAPGVLKEGFTEGQLPPEYAKMLGNQDILGWRKVTDANGTERIEVQTGPNTTQIFGARVGGAEVPGAKTNIANVDPTAALTAAYSQQLAAAKAAEDKAARQSAYDLLYQQFNQYGLGSLVENIKDLIQSNVSPSEFAIRLQNTDAYKQRFSANQDRIAKGLRALTPAEYIGLEDQYQNIMRNYGMPASYYSKDSMGTQAGFNKFIANDVSAAELEDRIATAQQRVINSDVNTKNALRQFYPNITDGDILAYTLDPTNALQDIKRKVTAAEIGGAALGQGLMTSAPSAETLAGYGITKAQAQQGYQTIGEFLPGATKLADIYQQQGLGPYTQATAEQEVFGTASAAEAARKRKRLSQLEQASFSGQSGTSQNALNRDRQMSNYMLGTPGAGQY